MDENKTILSIREKEVLKLYCEGKTVDEISDLIWISKLTVRDHLRNSKIKYDAKSLANLCYIVFCSTD